MFLFGLVVLVLYVFQQENLFMTEGVYNLEGWHARAVPHPDPQSFVPSRSSLVFSITRNAPVQPNGLTLAAFSPSTAVDALGRVLILSPEDFEGLRSLAQQTADLPQTGIFMNTWRIAQPRTSQPIERLVVFGEDGQKVQTSVQGYERGMTQLQTPVGDYTDLPTTLYTLFGLILEARDGYERGQEDEGIIDEVKALLQDE